MILRTMARRKNASRNRRRSSKNDNRAWLIGLGLVAFGIAALIGFRTYQSVTAPGERFASQGNVHIRLGDDHPPYNSNPPTSGWHTSDLAGWGSYDYVVPEERLIHNMEDGGVILWYALGTPEENDQRISALEDVSRGYRRIVIAPREDMPTTYALTAWQRLQRFDEIDEEGMRAFIDAYEGIDHHVP